ncbi:MAG: mitochondrial fission ELM1 family protein [Candidatus Omnitrophica bacterium]|nr:mitochondrial fission ELM1 family protein [Candidatus Omnitrophota bacterium]
MARLLLRLINVFVHLLPRPAARALGGMIGFSFYRNRRRRRNAFINIKQAFPEKSNRELFSIIRRSFISFGVSIIETFLVEQMKEEVTRQWSEKMTQTGEIFVGLHQGNWESYHADFARTAPLALLAKAQRYSVLDDYLNDLRKTHLVTVCFSLKEAIAALKKNMWVGLVIDHGAEKNARFVDFFGQLVPTPGGAVSLAKKFDKRIFPTFGYRKGKEQIFVIDDPLDCRDLSEEEALRKINEMYEEFLRAHPYEYMWWFKRFKRKKNRSILILSDGKAGHLKQSFALSKKVEEAGYRVATETVEVAYRHRWSRAGLDIVACFSSPWAVGRTRALRFFLKKEIWEKLEKRFYDIVISTGSSVAAANVLYARSLGAKSCVILRPNVPLVKFDTALVPEHDGIKGNNVITTKGALAYFEHWQEHVLRGKEHFRFTEEKKIAVCIGGALNDHGQYRERLGMFLAALKEYALKHQYRIVLTTSRRTERLVDEIIERELSSFPNTEALLLVSRENHPFVVPAFLAVSEIVCVSAESVSMISESLSQDKTTAAVFLEDLKSKPHRRFLASLEKEYLNFLKYPYGQFSFRHPTRSLRAQNEERLAEAVTRLL